jgi:hypothetical protein
MATRGRNYESSAPDQILKLNPGREHCARPRRSLALPSDRTIRFFPAYLPSPYPNSAARCRKAANAAPVIDPVQHIARLTRVRPHIEPHLRFIPTVTLVFQVAAFDHEVQASHLGNRLVLPALFVAMEKRQQPATVEAFGNRTAGELAERGLEIA